MRPSIAIAALLVTLSTSASAQLDISCPASAQEQGKPCTVARQTLTQPVVLRVLVNGAPAERVPLTLHLPAGMGAIDTIVTTGRDGYATAIWRAPANDTALRSASVQVEGESGGRRTSIQYLITYAPAKAPLRMAGALMESQSWFAKEQLKFRPRVVLDAPDEARCTGAVVVFKAYGGGEPSPDSARGSWEPGLLPCQATARWRLGETVGEQELRASLAGSEQAPLTFLALARKKPWLAAGFFAGYDFKYRKVTITSRSMQVVAHGAAADTTFTSTVDEGKSIGDAGGWTVRPTIGINTPIRASWPRVRVSLSADPQHIDSDWYAGISLPQFWNWVWNESMGADAQFVLHFARRDELADPLCEPQPMTCRNEAKPRLAGAGINLQLDASDLLSKFAGLLYAK